jgi:organic radical activating enzyme
MTSTDVTEHLLALGGKHLVVTGGEPLIQQKTLCELLVNLKKESYYVEIETNGTISPSDELLSLVDQWNVSPKLKNSGNPSSTREVPEAYHMFARLPSSYFKYVIQTESDLNEVRNLVSRYRIALARVLLMPEGTDRETILNRGRWLAKLCNDQGYRLGTRLHILLWGNARGT